ncbi:MAG: MBL fold metallo-hydrolase [Oligoflexia bacterium]|nr:MBL fold metallo-hydrolase [Oligoflexia bacterium]
MKDRKSSSQDRYYQLYRLQYKFHKLHKLPKLQPYLTAIFFITFSFTLSLILSLTPSSLLAYQHHCPTGSSWQNQLLIHVINVGQGDSTFIRTPKGTTILIDGGDLGKGTEDVIPTLKKCYKSSAVDYVILTHPHIDHFGGLIDVLDSITVNHTIYDNGDRAFSSKGPIAENYLQLANDSAPRKIASLGKKLIKSDGSTVSFNVVSINTHTAYDNEKLLTNEPPHSNIDPNALSLAMVISYGQFKYYTGGDLTGTNKGDAIDLETLVARSIGKVDVMKSNHHGSATANNLYFLTTLEPKNMIITVGVAGRNSTYHLPNYKTFERMLLLPFLKSIHQTTEGETANVESINPDALFSMPIKQKIEDDDIIILANKQSYTINNVRYLTSNKR